MRRLSTNVLSFIHTFSISLFLVLVVLFLVCLVSLLRVVLFYFFYFKTSMYSCVTRMSLVCSQSCREKRRDDEDGKSRYPGALSPVLENFRRAFSLDPTDCPWVSEDDSYVTRMLLVCTRMYSYVIGVYPYVLVGYSYVLVWCFSHDPFFLSSFTK